MSLQVTAGRDSLIALGIGVSDIATLWSLGRLVGNWWTAESGDKQLLEMLDADELSLLHRPGIMNTKRFNLVWSQAMSLLANGESLLVEGPEARETVGELSTFTACMVAIIATLDAFASNSVVRVIMKNLLIELLRGTERGEDLMTAELNNRINAWRSAGSVRRLHLHIAKIRISLVKAHKVLDGFIPFGEATEVSQFLYWLLASRSDTLRTSSSDISGIAKCLSMSGFDPLGVEAFGDTLVLETPCRLIYDMATTSLPLKFDIEPGSSSRNVSGNRRQSTAVSLTQPEECMGSFPISKTLATRARGAWKRGSKAATSVLLRLRKPKYSDIAIGSDLYYEVVNEGSDCGRVDNLGVHALASAHGLVLNRELCDEMEMVLERETEQALQWLLSQTQMWPMMRANVAVSHEVKNPLDLDISFDGTDESAELPRIETFTVFQAFLMGYYYGVFLQLVDTSSLQLQAVDGAWGYRSIELLGILRKVCSRASQDGISREKMLEILSRLLFSSEITIGGSQERGGWCVGVTGKRTILSSSLLQTCHTPADIGRFVLLDVDVGNLPSDKGGLLHSGPNRTLQRVDNAPGSLSLSPKQLDSKKEPTDCTRHIEADWDYDPEKVLLCFRFKGRRIITLNIADVDIFFCLAYSPPVPNPLHETLGPLVISTIQDCLAGKILEAKTNSVLVHTGGNPCMRYMFAALYAAVPVAVATNCLHAATKQAEQVGIECELGTFTVVIY